MPPRPHTLSRIAAGAAVLALLGCGGPAGPDPSGTTGSSSSVRDSPTITASSSTTSSSGTSPTASRASRCVGDVRQAMTPVQQPRQLMMTALARGPVTRLDSPIAEQGVGSMLSLGGWRDAQTVTNASRHLQQVAPTIDGTKVGML